MEDLVRTTFEAGDAPKALIVYVGQREEYVIRSSLSDRYMNNVLTTGVYLCTFSWKGRADNPYRGDPWSIDSVPTILKTDVRYLHFHG